jgi:hypothetical protein
LWLDGGADETYEVSLAADGAGAETRSVIVSRGDDIDLGEIALS